MVGRVARIGRYAVKSMQGESPDRVEVAATGVVGDRVRALVDAESGKIASAKDPRAWAGLFQMRALGGGDVKLLAAASLWIGWTGLLPFVVWVGVAGGGLVLILLALRKNLPMLVAWASPTIPQSWPRVLTSGEKVPYGVAIAIGAIILVVQGNYGILAF